MIGIQTTLAQAQAVPVPGVQAQPVQEVQRTIFDTFAPFTAMHVVIIVVFVLLTTCAVLIGRELATQEREQTFRRVWCIFVLIWQVMATAWWCSPANYVASISLPLHVCDVAGFLVPLALWTQHRWLRSLLYFWAIGLCTQAFVTPVEDAGIGQIPFWLFWVGHAQIIGSSIYDVAVGGFRPNWRDYRSATIMMVLYAVVIVPFNLYNGFNYGYLGEVLPEKKTILHALPPWPWRLLALFAIMQTAYLTIWLVWPIGTRIRKQVNKPEA